MPQQDKPKTTQRAYTLRLRGTDPQDTSWRTALWQTHEAVNNGAKVFGDWLLTLRGGLDHTLENGNANGGDVGRKGRRILLALSWLSVESELGAPTKFVIASGQEAGAERNKKVIDALRKILVDRGLTPGEIDEWIGDCQASLSAAVRDDAVWVNRSSAFDVACGTQVKQDARKDAQTLLWFLLTDDYLLLPKEPVKKQSKAVDQQEEEEEPDSEASAEVVAKSGRGAGQRTRHPFSHIFGKESTQDFGKPPRRLDLRDHWREHLKPLVRDAGIPLSDPNSKNKGNPPSPTELHREMFSKAAARLAQTWTKQKQQEVARQLRAAGDEELKKLENDDAHCKALQLLDTFCLERGQVTGSLEEYRIKPRAMMGWERVIAAWNKITETDPDKAAEKRIEETKRLQDEDADKKFGDINLFVSLADTQYEPVWRHKEQATTSIVETYVKGWKARTDAVRLKVAAFRHPDPYFHPVFCQFGVSRPAIKYGRLGTTDQGDARNVQMRLWTGSQAVDTTLLAVSNRFDKEIGSIDVSTSNSPPLSAPEVTRRSRLGIVAVAKPDENATYRVAHVFDEQERKSRKKTDDDDAQDEAGDDDSQGGKQKKPLWNGTLQANRRELEAIGRMESSKLEKVQQAKRQLRWWLIVSLELQQKGPWYDFIDGSRDKAAFTRVYESGKNKGTEYVNWDGWPHEKANEVRKGDARLILSRLPGLRVLSVDLGHRYAAACAVWEAVSAEEVKAACRAILHDLPKATDMYLHLQKRITKQKKGKEVEIGETTIYRRIGADSLPDGNPHPAPWARLDRQFLIKLQGEEEGAREASNDEIWAVHQLEAELGRAEPLIDQLVKAEWGQTVKQQSRLDALEKLGWSRNTTSELDRDEERKVYPPSLAVDQLVSSTVRNLRDALKRHGDRARIAFAMTSEYKPMPGDRKYVFADAKDASSGDDENTKNEKHVGYIQDALLLWHELAFASDWTDGEAKKLWNNRIANLSDYAAPAEIGTEESGAERKTKRTRNRDLLRSAAESLVKDMVLRGFLHRAWRDRWASDDRLWKKHLRWFKDWILPRGKYAGVSTIRRVGGLSLTRLATMTEFRRKIQVGYFTRLRPDGTKFEAKEKFGSGALDSLEHLRDQRVKQLSSRITEAALGIGRMKHPVGSKDPKRPQSRVDVPCHVVVIENLTHYRPDEIRTRRENRQLMTMASSKVKKYLAEACQLNGLHLREVSAGYTSRQDSRTGAPGVRCQDIPVSKFMQSTFWRKEVAQAEKKQTEGKGDAREKFLCELNAKWKDKKEVDWKSAGTIRIPRQGGEVFVSANSGSPAAKGLQADLNAAANIGLRALNDPDWPGRWWYVPCDSTTFKPVADKTKGSHAISDIPLEVKDASMSVATTAKKTGKSRSGTRSKEITNLWRDISADLVKDGPWKVYSAYRNNVQMRVIDILRKSSRVDTAEIQPSNG